MYKHLATSMDGFSGGAIAVGKNAYAGPVSNATAPGGFAVGVAHCKHAEPLADRHADAGSGRGYGPHTVVSTDFGNLAVDLGSNAVKALLVVRPVGVARVASNLLADNLVVASAVAVTTKLGPAYDTHEIRNAVA